VVLDGVVHGAPIVARHLPGNEAEGVCEVYENAKEREEEGGYVK